MKKILTSKFTIFIIFVLAFAFRLYGLNWDQGQHLHPDERFLTMVASDIKFPDNIAQYFDTQKSPLNPGNHPNYQFFVYGTFPLFLTKFLSSLFHQDVYSTVQFWGRGLSAFFDSLNIFWLYFIFKKLKPKSKIFFLPSLVYALTILPIQLSHFFAVDTFLTSLLTLTFCLLTYRRFLLAAFVFGLSLATKISALYFVPIIGLFLIYDYLQSKNIFRVVQITSFGLVVSLLVFRIFQPYAFTGVFTINPLFINNLKTLDSFNNPDAWYPPGVQWISQIPLLYPFKNFVIFGFGLIPFLILTYYIIKKLITKPKPILNPFSIAGIWVVWLFLYQGSQFVHTMRYLLPLYPFVCLILSYLISSKNTKIIVIFIAINFIGCLMFLNIYSRPHSRVQASYWIYQNISASSKITNEYWDDPLPLYLSGHNPNQYKGTMLPLYDPDTTQKWSNLLPILNKTNYMILSSNRLWGSITRVPARYPQTSKFYEQLFTNQLNFRKTMEINSYPGISLLFLKQCYYLGPTNFPGMTNSWFTKDPQCNYPGIYFRDDTAEEAFTVYDHPKVLIFQNLFK